MSHLCTFSLFSFNLPHFCFAICNWGITYDMDNEAFKVTYMGGQGGVS
ncbi:hypothetical protein CI610_03629 [invertebrate metagenome]|uniref:Uncharacterized protein n=1 Tax=invertebrate metagenome TaxID=1711999 RepID=A0A2H9T2L1_9ZZZZ